jgi:hypothetical protein
MKKFSKLINEDKNIDVYPDFMQDILDLFQTFKEMYDYVNNVEISRGWTTKLNLNRMNVNSISFKSPKKMRLLFPDGIITNDKWVYGIRILISYKKLDPDHENPDANIYDISSVDELINRYRAIKTLALRCQNYANTVKISYNTGISSDKISLIVIFD